MKPMKLNYAPDEIWQRLDSFIAFGFGSGAMPIIPGTFGTLMAIPFYLFASQFSLTTYLVITAALIIFAMVLCDRISMRIGVDDHPGMVIDEFPGFFVTMIAIPQGWAWLWLGFLLFRFFDILKPFPIGWLDKNIKGGFGMVLDDLAAGLFAWVVLQIVAHASHWF